MKRGSSHEIILDTENKRPNGRSRLHKVYTGSDGREYRGKGAKARIRLERRQRAEERYLEKLPPIVRISESRARSMPGSMQL